ncbi:MAG: M20/M25/M40 family metallo-hydrolase [Elusimicrobiales bacterium]|nr:M20/M25/M40 family metallo-hydrolase [Elusimicrobiales bacterium]
MNIIIDRRRLRTSFMELARIPSPCGGEGALARRLERELKGLGARVMTDGAGRKTGGACGNLLAFLPGTVPAEPLLLAAHMDTVGPCARITPIVKGGRITSDGTSVLGADCKAGIAVMLEAVRALRAAGAPVPPLEMVFTVSEEMGLLGARHLDYSRLSAKRGLVLDSERPLEEVTVSAPAADRVEIKVYGVAAHAGVAPERGLSAIGLAAEAISRMRLGRIDGETTANIGVIRGGDAINVVTPLVELKGEARSHRPDRLKRQTGHMEDCFRRALTGKWVKSGDGRLKPSYEFLAERKYPNMKVPGSSPVLRLISEAMRKKGMNMKKTASGGGTDANVMYGHGIEAPVLATGMREVHTTGEYLILDEFHACAGIAADVITGWASRGPGVA